MRKIYAVCISLILLLTVSFSCAEMGVQVIGGSESETAQPVSLDDLKLEEAAEIEGWGTITLTESRYSDFLIKFKEGKHTPEGNWERFDSGVEAEYLFVKADILNNTKKEHDYLGNVEVKVIFNDDVEYAGWFWQYNWDNGTKDYDWDEEGYNGIQNKELVIDKKDQFSIGPYYTGHYLFGCTLPNAIVESKEPLRMEIKIDGNEITYNIRK